MADVRVRFAAGGVLVLRGVESVEAAEPAASTVRRTWCDTCRRLVETRYMTLHPDGETYTCNRCVSKHFSVVGGIADTNVDPDERGWVECDRQRAREAASNVAGKLARWRCGACLHWFGFDRKRYSKPGDLKHAYCGACIDLVMG